MMNPDDIKSVKSSLDKIGADHFENLGNIASGLDLSEIDLDGHGVANMCWAIAHYLRERNK